MTDKCSYWTFLLCFSAATAIRVSSAHFTKPDPFPARGSRSRGACGQEGLRKAANCELHVLLWFCLQNRRAIPPDPGERHLALQQ